jgi:periplasmic protein CpxP/Spy
MNKPSTLVRSVVIALFSVGLAVSLFGQQALPRLQMAELTKKLQLTDQQQKQLAPIVAQRDKEAEALKADTSMGKLPKLRRFEGIQTDFRTKAARVLTPDQVKKLDALQAERRAKLTGRE